jgi:hypothetical protein
MKKTLFTIAVLLLAVSTFGQQTYNPPTVYAGTGLHILTTAGTVNNGGKPVTIAATAATAVSDSETDCSAPAYASCNFIYANSSGTVAATQTLATATASGNVILAYVQTASAKITNIIYGWQSGAVFSNINALTGGGASSIAGYICGSTSTCSATATAQFKFAYGTVALGSASPSTVTVTALPFTTTAFTCTASPTGSTAAIAAAGVAVSYSSETVIFTGPNTVTTVINYVCAGV